VGWSNTNNAVFSACGGLSSCSEITDDSGTASTWVTPEVPGVATITATLAPGVYNPAQSVVGTLLATETSLDIGMTMPYLWVAQGATVKVPITARVLSNGSPRSGYTVTFAVRQGVGSLSAASATTDGSGNATVILTLTGFTGSVLLAACVDQANGPCGTVSGNAVAPALMNLQAVAGAGQVVAGQAFQPLIVRVTDSSTPPNPVLGASVLFQSTVLRSTGNNFALTGGNSQSGMPVILSESQPIPVASDANGLASFLPSVASFTGALQVEIQISAGATAWLQDELEVFPP
jgi:hypothetical protein